MSEQIQHEHPEIWEGNKRVIEDLIVPSGYDDNSWHNDAMALFTMSNRGLHFALWVGEAERDQRDYPSYSRFTLCLRPHPADEDVSGIDLIYWEMETEDELKNRMAYFGELADQDLDTLDNILAGITKCDNCGEFFIPEKKSDPETFCSDHCKLHHFER